MSMARYQCHKQVNAGQITAIDLRTDGDTRISYRNSDGGESWLNVQPKFIDQHRPVLDGYLVLYDDSYLSFSPRQVFEGGYTLTK